MKKTEKTHYRAFNRSWASMRAVSTAHIGTGLPEDPYNGVYETVCISPEGNYRIFARTDDENKAKINHKAAVRRYLHKKK